ncbi:MAG: aldolase catalytic domain-containing protein [bacterium]
MYRPEIKVIDCTIRDGGLINDHQFSDRLVKAVYRACSLAGVDYVELGYQLSKKQYSPDKFGRSKFCDDDFIREMTAGVENGAKIATMVDIGRVELEEIKPKKESAVDLIRTACYVKDIDKAIDYTNHFHAKGYETTVNIMAISTALIPDLEEGLSELAKSPVKAVYIVDSYGALFSEQIHFLVNLYKKCLQPKGIEVGIHTHNNQQLGFANTIEAIRKGANYLDATIFGIGRGPGNCPLELLVAFLKNPKFKLEPVLEVIEEEMIPLRGKIEWGYIIPYMVTGVLNMHPRSAIALRSGPDKDKYTQFYRTCVTDVV